MNDDLSRPVAVMVALFLLVMAIAWWAVADETADLPTADAILAYDIGVEIDRAYRLADVIDEAARDHDLDPLLIAALVRRESAFWTSVEERRLFGERGEIGLMQTHGVALRYRPDECSSRLEGAWCQVQTGAAFLAYARAHCGGSPWRWVAAYGMSSCPSEHAARENYATKRAHGYYREIGGTGWD